MIIIVRCVARNIIVSTCDALVALQLPNGVSAGNSQHSMLRQLPRGACNPMLLAPSSAHTSTRKFSSAIIARVVCFKLSTDALAL
jgi:hypothetical protein